MRRGAGAVKAIGQGNTNPGHLGALLTAITPAVEQVKDQPGDIVQRGTDACPPGHEATANRRALLAQRIREKLVTIVGARHDLDTGDIELLA